MIAMGPTRSKLLIAVVIAVLWEVLPRIGLVPRIILSPLSDSLAVAVTSHDLYLTNLRVTLMEIGMALVIACGGGVVFGSVLGTMPRVRQLLLPLVSSAYAVPFVLLYPLITLWFGLGSGSKVAFAGVYGLFPVLFTTVAGMQSIDRHLVKVARAMGAKGLTLVVKVVMPMAIPIVLGAVKIGAAVVVSGVVAAEMLLSSEGIGYIIMQNRTTFNTPEIYLAILVTVGIAWVLERAIFLLERSVAGWSQHLSTEQEGRGQS